MNNEFEKNSELERDNGFSDDGYKTEAAGMNEEGIDEAVSEMTKDTINEVVNEMAGQTDEDMKNQTSKGAHVDNAVNFIMSNTPGGREESPKLSEPEQEASSSQSSQFGQAAQGSTAYGFQGDGAYRYSYHQNSGTGNGTPNRHYTYQYQQASQTSQNRQERKPKKKKSRPELRKVLVCAGLAVVFGVVASVGFQVTNFVGERINPSRGTAETIPQVDVDSSKDSVTGTSSDKTSVTDVTNVVTAVMPSIVSITNVSEQQIPSFFGGMQSRESSSSGTGIIVGQNDDELLIATNNHVVADSKTLTVVFNDEGTAKATIKGTDSAKDLAVIAVKKKEISDTTTKKIKVATLGDSKTLKVGEPAIAIGNALGYGQSVTTGVISALERQVSVENVTNKLIQTDAAINPGNSGGALLNTKGEVIGINAAKFSSSGVEGMGYAIPISDATPILNKLMTKTTREKVDVDKQGYLGIRGANVTQEFSEIYGLPTGACVSEATKGGAADEAGIKRGDIIVEFDGTTIDSMETLQNTMQYYKAGEKVEVKIQTPDGGGEYKEETLQIKLDKRPQE